MTNYDKVNVQVELINDEYPEPYHPWQVAYTDTIDGETVTTILIENDFVTDYFTWKYGEWICRNMWDKFLMFVSTHSRELEKAQQAYDTSYTPLTDYAELVERIHARDDGDETRTHTTGGTDGTHKKVTTQALANTYTQHDTTTYDSQTPRMESKDTQNGGNETTDDLHTTDTTSHSTTSMTMDGDTYTGDQVNKEKVKKEGYKNAPQDNIEKEIALRLRPVNCMFLDQFIKEYAYYIGGAWECDWT